MAINLSKTEEQLTNDMMKKINLSKDKEVLESHVVNLSKCIVNLSKKSEVDLGDTVARVIVVLDYSWSMNLLYNKGVVQQVLNKLVPLGLTFDDNGELEVYLFNDRFKKMKDMNIDNYGDYVEQVIVKSEFEMGTTYYAPVLSAINDLHKIGKAEALSNFIFRTAKRDETFFVVFITDGNNFDEKATNSVIRELSETKTFVQFIGIGKEKFKYLEKLDTLSGREVDNTGFTKFDEIAKVEDNELYEEVLKQFAEWLKEVEK